MREIVERSTAELGPDDRVQEAAYSLIPEAAASKRTKNASNLDLTLLTGSNHLDRFSLLNRR
jgi:hypothetical protein